MILGGYRQEAETRLFLSHLRQQSDDTININLIKQLCYNKALGVTPVDLTIEFNAGDLSMKVFSAFNVIGFILFVLLQNKAIADPQKILLKKISENPDNNKLRLQYADLLGRSARASFIRAQVNSKILKAQGNTGEANELSEKAIKIFNYNQESLSEIPGTDGLKTTSSSGLQNYNRGFLFRHRFTSREAYYNASTIDAPLNGLSPVNQLEIIDNHGTGEEKRISEQTFIQIGTSPGFSRVRHIILDLGSADSLANSTSMLKLAPKLDRLLIQSNLGLIDTKGISRVTTAHSLKVKKLLFQGLSEGSLEHIAKWQTLNSVEELDIYSHRLFAEDFIKLSQSNFISKIKTFRLSYIMWKQKEKTSMDAIAKLLDSMHGLEKLELSVDLKVTKKLGQAIDRLRARGVAIKDDFTGCELLITRGIFGAFRSFYRNPGTK